MAAELSPDPLGGGLKCFPTPPDGPISRNMGAISKGRRGEGSGREKGDGEGRRKGKMEKGRERRDTGGRMG